MLVTDVFVWIFFFFFLKIIIIILWEGVVILPGLCFGMVFVFAYMPCRIKYRFSCISNYNSRALQELCLFESVDE